MKHIKLLFIFSFIFLQQICFSQQKLKVVIAGLSHDHVNRMLDKNKTGEIIIVAIAEPDEQLRNSKKTAYNLPDAIFYKNITAALKKSTPDIVMVFNAPAEHLPIIETCMPLHIPVWWKNHYAFPMPKLQKLKCFRKNLQPKYSLIILRYGTAVL